MLVMPRTKSGVQLPLLPHRICQQLVVLITTLSLLPLSPSAFCQIFVSFSSFACVCLPVTATFLVYGYEYDATNCYQIDPQKENSIPVFVLGLQSLFRENPQRDEVDHAINE